MEAAHYHTLQAFQRFLETPLDQVLYAPDAGEVERSLIEFFQRVAVQVPAYRSFLQTHQIDPQSIQTLSEFQQLPLVTKANYLQCHPLPDLCAHGQLETSDLIAVSSGSTGQPTFWPRFITDELAIATRFEQIFHDSFRADQRRTLAVVCFALGTWVGGLFTTSCCRYLASKGYPVTVIAPGNQKAEILRVVQALGSWFDQVVLLGYPPFLKDVIDSGIAEGVNWSQYSIRWVMAGEVFSEEWRTLVGARVGSEHPYFDSASLYGTADAGVLGNETPLSICIRRWLSERPEIARELFGESRLPTLVQYDPRSRFFEVQDGTLLFSGDNGIPLVRYHIADEGGILPYQTLLEFLAGYGFDPIAELQPYGDRGIRPLPFVYVFGRSHFTVSYFGANIYPENVTVGLEQSPICEWVTGKFVMQVQFDAEQNPTLVIVVELAPGINASQEKSAAIATAIQQQLRRLNSEFANYVPAAYQSPQIHLRATSDPDHFPIGVKHRYTRPPLELQG